MQSLKWRWGLFQAERWKRGRHFWEGYDIGPSDLWVLGAEGKEGKEERGTLALASVQNLL